MNKKQIAKKSHSLLNFEMVLWEFEEHYELECIHKKTGKEVFPLFSKKQIKDLPQINKWLKHEYTQEQALEKFKRQSWDYLSYNFYNLRFKGSKEYRYGVCN